MNSQASASNAGGAPQSIRDARGTAMAAGRGSPPLSRSPGRRLPDYAAWSFEELRALAAQLQVPNALAKNRSELIRLFDVSRA